MTQITISAQVVNGHLLHEQPLPELEGQRVLATLTVAPKATTKSGNLTQQAPAQLGQDANFDPEPPPWLEVENDVFFPMLPADRMLEKKELIVEQGTPSMVFPEELPDE